MFRVIPLRVAWPPPPHDPRERVVVCDLGGWQVRSFLLTDPKFQYFAPRGLWHLQLWHPEAAVSVLTPSGLTADRYEVFPIRGRRRRIDGPDELRAVLRIFHNLAPPSAGMLKALESFFVHDAVEGFLAAAERPVDGWPRSDFHVKVTAEH